MSQGGAVVAFESAADDLTREDPDTVIDVFATDLTRGGVTLLSKSTALPGVPGVKGDGPSRGVRLSASGRLAVFSSDARNLLTPAADGNGATTDVFLRDLGRETTVIVSISAAGVAGNGPSEGADISGDGGTVAFQSLATNLVTGARPADRQRIHVVDIATGRVAIIGPAGGRGDADGDSRGARLSADGRFVAFESDATNLVDTDGNRVTDVFVHDRSTGLTTRASVKAGRGELSKPSTNPRISADGRYVAFESPADDLVLGDQKGVDDIFVRDMVTGDVERVSVDAKGIEGAGPASLGGISADGRFVSFHTVSPLSAVDRNELPDVYLRDRLLRRTLLVSETVPAVGGPPVAANGASRRAVVSDDGRFVAFDTIASDLARTDRNERLDVYRAELPVVDEGPFPPSNNVLLHVDGVLQQFDPSGRATAYSFSAARSEILGVAADDRNAVWVRAGASLFRLRAMDLMPAQDAAAVPRDPPAGAFHALVAGNGYAWEAAGLQILRVAPDGETVAFGLVGAVAPAVTRISLALDPFHHVWAGLARPGGFSLLKLTPDLRLLRAVGLNVEFPFTDIACDAEGAVLARSERVIAKFSRAGGLVWTRSTPPGGGLAVDAYGDVYTIAGDNLVGFHGTGRHFLRVSLPAGLPDARAATLGIDGEGRLYAAVEGARVVLRIDLAATPPSARTFTTGSVGTLGGGDPTGFIAANVASPSGDMDSDGYLNRAETSRGLNPFDPRDPSPKSRMLPVLDLAATPLGGRQVRLDWTSPRAYVQFFVFRDGRPIAGSPFPFASAAGGIVDSNVPGGVHVYKVIGQGLGGGGGGAGIGPDEEGIEEPFSLSQQVSVSQGEGSVLISALLPSAPDAIAHDASAQRVFVVLEGGLLWTLDQDLHFVDETALPADPFASNEVRGLAVDGDDPGRPLYLLLGDGRVFKRSGNGAPAALFTLSGNPPAVGGYTGFAPLTGGGNDLFTTMAGPGVDCLIGFFRNSGGFKPGAETSVGGAISAPILHSVGLSRIGADLLAGVGLDSGSPPPTIDRVVKLSVGPNFGVTDASASVSLAALASSDISGFVYAPGRGLYVADRGGTRVALVEALFPGTLKILNITPPVGRWNGVTADVAIAGTGFGNDPGALQVRFDGLDVPVKSLQGGTILVDAPEIDAARQVEVEVSTLASTDYVFPGFTYGFQRGEGNNDGKIDISDALFLLSYLFLGGPPPPCEDAADADDNETLEITDAVYILNFLFSTGVPPKPPYPDLGIDDISDLLTCQE